MIKKYLFLICLTIFGLIPLNSVSAEVQTNPIQNELYNLCQFRLDDTLESIIQDNYLKTPEYASTKPEGYEKFTTYEAPVKRPEINNIPLHRDMTLQFFDNQLWTVSFNYNKQIETALIDYFTQKIGTPIVRKYPSSTDMVWESGEYSISLISLSSGGSLMFTSSVIGKKTVNPERDEANLIEWVKYAKDIGQLKSFERNIRDYPDYKKDQKSLLNRYPKYKEALQNAGVDMTVFD